MIYGFYFLGGDFRGLESFFTFCFYLLQEFRFGGLLGRGLLDWVMVYWVDLGKLHMVFHFLSIVRLEG